MVSQVRRQTHPTQHRHPAICGHYIHHNHAICSHCTLPRTPLQVVYLSRSPTLSLPISLLLHRFSFFAQLTFLKCLAAVSTVSTRSVYDDAVFRDCPDCLDSFQSSMSGACAASNCNCCYHKGEGEGKGLCVHAPNQKN